MADMTNMTNMTNTPTLLDVELVSPGWINKYLLKYQLADGSVIEYESVSRKGLEQYKAQLETNARGEGGRPEHADAVCIVPVLPDDSLLLIREFRYPVNGWVIAFPAGLIEPGETLRECVDRELMEEAGCRVRTDFDGDPLIRLPQSGFSSVGMGEENVSVAIAYVEPAGEPRLQGPELIETFTLQRNDVGPFLDKNTDLIGTRAQLLLEAVRRTNVLKKRLALQQNPITKSDFA